MSTTRKQARPSSSSPGMAGSYSFAKQWPKRYARNKALRLRSGEEGGMRSGRKKQDKVDERVERPTFAARAKPTSAERRYDAPSTQCIVIPSATKPSPGAFLQQRMLWSCPWTRRSTWRLMMRKE